MSTSLQPVLSAGYGGPPGLARQNVNHNNNNYRMISKRNIHDDGLGGAVCSNTAGPASGNSDNSVPLGFFIKSGTINGNAYQNPAHNTANYGSYVGPLTSRPGGISNHYNSEGGPVGGDYGGGFYQLNPRPQHQAVPQLLPLAYSRGNTNSSILQFHPSPPHQRGLYSGQPHMYSNNTEFGGYSMPGPLPNSFLARGNTTRNSGGQMLQYCPPMSSYVHPQQSRHQQKYHQQYHFMGDEDEVFEDGGDERGGQGDEDSGNFAFYDRFHGLRSLNPNASEYVPAGCEITQQQQQPSYRNFDSGISSPMNGMMDDEEEEFVEVPRRIFNNKKSSSDLMSTAFISSTFADDFDKFSKDAQSSFTSNNNQDRFHRSKDLLFLSSSTPVKRLTSGDDLRSMIEEEEEKLEMDGWDDVEEKKENKKKKETTITKTEKESSFDDVCRLMKFDELLSFEEDEKTPSELQVNNSNTISAEDSDEDSDCSSLLSDLPSKELNMASIIFNKNNNHNNHLPLPCRNYRKASVDLPLGLTNSKHLNRFPNSTPTTTITPCRTTRAASISLDTTDFYSHLKHRRASLNSTSSASKFKEQLYKTEMCRNMTELGSCEYGDECYFAHSEAEQRQAKVGRQLHPNHRTVPCTEWDKGNICKFGRRCAFIHQKPVASFNAATDLSPALWDAFFAGDTFEPRMF